MFTRVLLIPGAILRAAAALVANASDGRPALACVLVERLMSGTCRAIGCNGSAAVLFSWTEAPPAEFPNVPGASNDYRPGADRAPFGVLIPADVAARAGKSIAPARLRRTLPIGEHVRVSLTDDPTAWNGVALDTVGMLPAQRLTAGACEESYPDLIRCLPPDTEEEPDHGQDAPRLGTGFDMALLAKVGRAMADGLEIGWGGKGPQPPMAVFRPSPWQLRPAVLRMEAPGGDREAVAMLMPARVATSIAGAPFALPGWARMDLVSEEKTRRRPSPPAAQEDHQEEDHQEEDHQEEDHQEEDHQEEAGADDGRIGVVSIGCRT